MQAETAASGSPDPVSVQQVLETLQGLLVIDNRVRNQAETLVKSWEQNAAPGFLMALVDIAKQAGAIDENIRLLAVVVAKNAVGSSWKRLLGTREWSRVPDEEKAGVREAAFQLLLTEPNDKVAVQVALLITNIARFDFPARWEQLLNIIMSASSMDSPWPPHIKLRALKALRHVLHGLITKRFVVDVSNQTADADFFKMSERINQERQLFRTKLHELYAPLHSTFLQHSQAFLTCAPNWDLHGSFAKAAVKAYQELLQLAPASEELQPGTKEVLEQMHTVCTCVGNNKPQGNLEGASKDVWLERGGRLYEGVLGCIIAFMATPIPFAEYVPFFLQLFVENAIIATDAAALREMRAKRRVLLVRFIARALLCPFYRPEFIEAPPTVVPGTEAKVASTLAKARKAHEAVQRMLAPDGGWCGALMEALISKYVVLTKQELEEWSDEPESYLRSVDVESTPDADTPRPIGVGLLLCMLERGGEPVANTLLALAARLQSDSSTPEAILMREATYRVIGEGFPHLSGHITFQVWYQAELSPLLHSQAASCATPAKEVLASVLQARALWLVGVCGGELGQEAWLDAYRLSVRYMGATDLVVALTAVSAVLALSAAVMSDQHTLEEWTAQQKGKPGAGRGASEALNTADEVEAAAMMQEQEILMDEVRQRVSQRVEALSGAMGDALTGCFHLLGRLSEVESMVRVLQLVSMLVEVMADRMSPHLHVIATALPQVWSKAIGHSSTSDTGAVVRLHSALIAVLTHLVTKLRAIATQDARIMGVVFPLLQFATNLGNAESEVLVEEAFRLWNTTISSLPNITQELLELLPNLARILERGKDNAAVYPLLESYMFMGQGAALQPYMTLIGASIMRSITAATKALELLGTKPAGQPTQPLTAELGQEALATTALMDVMLQLYPGEEMLQALMTPLKALTAMTASPSIPMKGVSAKVMNMLTGAVEVLSRVLITHPQLYGPLTDSNPEVQARFMDRFLQVAGMRFVEEMIGVKTMVVLGRFRRRIAAASLCAMLAADVGLSVLLEPQRVVRTSDILVQAVLEDSDFFRDQSELDGMDFKRDLGEDVVLARRIEFSKSDVLRNAGLKEQVRTLLRKLASAVGGEAPLLQLCAQHQRKLGMQLEAVLGGSSGLNSQQQQQQQQLMQRNK